MRGGTIPGTVHLNHFRPMLDELFGDRWLINGAVSMYYTYATSHLEDVRAVIKAPPGRCWDEDAVFPAWVETPDGKTVCKGTVVDRLAADAQLHPRPAAGPGAAPAPTASPRR